MERGRFRIGMSMIGSFMHTSHEVEPIQREPGLPAELQPTEHVLDSGLLEWDLDAQLGVHRRFAFELMLPIRVTMIDASFRLGDSELIDFQSIHHRDETIAGLGDMVVGGRTAVVLPEDVKRWTLVLRAGASLPTGRTEPNPFALALRGEDHQHTFFGSGTVDPFVGFDTNVAFEKWNLVAWSAAKIPVYRNRHGYRASRVLVGGIGARADFGLEKWSFLLQPEVYFETPASWGTAPARNSGRVSLLATGGVFFSPTPKWQLHLQAKVPYQTWSQNGELRWPFVGVLGFSYVFDVGRRANRPVE